MQFLDLTLSTLAENLALEEALLLEAEAGRGDEVLRFWEWPKAAVVLGSGCRLAEDVDEATCHADSVPILRRSSGGGSVLLGAGCLCYSLVLAYRRSAALREVRPSYRFILEKIGEALRDGRLGIEHAGISDLAAGGRKCSGNAQQRKRNYLLHHGTLLYAFNLALVGRYLHLPSRQPDYRQSRAHATFLSNLPVDAAHLKGCLRAAWAADTGYVAWPEETVRQLVAGQYTCPEWIRRR